MNDNLLSRLTDMLTDVTLARLITLNKELLAQLTVEEVLRFHPLLERNSLPMRRCQKTRPIKAKPVSSIVADKSVTSRLLLATLEANERVDPNAIVCRGVADDLWMQT